jgi:hypothetical protein
MVITTNPQLERNGADAIHIARKDDKYILYLGEAKAYESGFKPAFKKAMKSILKTYDEHRSELNLYQYNQFISPELESLANRYLSGAGGEFEIHLVSVIAYEADSRPIGNDYESIIASIREGVEQECVRLVDADYADFKELLLTRMNHIVFPIHGLAQLLDVFKRKLGV